MRIPTTELRHSFTPVAVAHIFTAMLVLTIEDFLPSSPGEQSLHGNEALCSEKMTCCMELCKSPRSINPPEGVRDLD